MAAICGHVFFKHRCNEGLLGQWQTGGRGQLARRSGKQKLIGWGAFAAILVVIAAIFLVTRLFGGAPSAPGMATPPRATALSSTAPDASSAAANTFAAPTNSGAVAVAEASAASNVPPPPATVEVVDAATMTQQSRRGLLLTLIQQGVFTGVQALDTPPKVGVTALFKGLSLSLQRQFIAVVYAYINNGAPGTQTLQLIDAANGSQVGSYSAGDGLKLGQG